MTEEMQAKIQETCSLFPEVAWDRFVSMGDQVICYGWIDRAQDSYKDFLVLEFYAIENPQTLEDTFHIAFTTSSATLSEGFGKRLGYSGHTPCRRMETFWPDLPKVIKLEPQA